MVSTTLMLVHNGSLQINPPDPSGAHSNKLNPEHMVVLLAGSISHTSTQYIDFAKFLYFTGFSTIYFAHFSEY